MIEVDSGLGQRVRTWHGLLVLATKTIKEKDSFFETATVSCGRLINRRAPQGTTVFSGFRENDSFFMN